MTNNAQTSDSATRESSSAGRIRRERALFEALRESGRPTVSAKRLVAALGDAGLGTDDPRLAGALSALQDADPDLDFEAFQAAISPSILTVERALRGDLVLPDFPGFTRALSTIFEKVIADRRGAVADYIPQLGRVDAELFGAAVVSVDGQRFSIGDSTPEFCVQSTCKPISYCLALEQHGEDHVHKHIGCEPSGVSFNELKLNPNGLPHNPMINAGAIMSGSLIQPDLTMADRFDHVLGKWRDLAGGTKPGFSNATYLSERCTADRNFALGYFMRENGAFPEGTDIVSALEFYFQCCSIEMNVESMAMVAATLANGGVCPTTGERVLRSSTVQKCLTMMYSCGMYDYSGEWAFRIGLPAKSGVSGAVLVVVPNVAGFCTWSPRLDAQGNSIRGIEFFTELVNRFNFHNYDSLAGAEGKVDPRRRPGEVERDLAADLCWAASEGDLDGMRRLAAQGVPLDASDYDGRTALHLAASEGHERVVAFLVDKGVALNPRDRWGNTPQSDAEREGHDAVIKVLTAKRPEQKEEQRETKHRRPESAGAPR